MNKEMVLMFISGFFFAIAVIGFILLGLRLVSKP